MGYPSRAPLEHPRQKVAEQHPLTASIDEASIPFVKSLKELEDSWGTLPNLRALCKRLCAINGRAAAKSKKTMTRHNAGYAKQDVDDSPLSINIGDVLKPLTASDEAPLSLVSLCTDLSQSIVNNTGDNFVVTIF